MDSKQNSRQDRALPQEDVAETDVRESQVETDNNAEKEKNIDPKKKRVRKILLTLLLVTIIAAVIVYTAVKDFSGGNVDIGNVFRQIKDNWYYLIVLLGLFFLTIFAETLKFFMMIRKTTGKYMFGTAFTNAALGKFYDYVTPFGSGGQPFQIYYLAKNGVPGGPAGAIPIGSMFLSQFTFFVCAVVSFIVGVDANVASIDIPIYIQILAYFGAVCYISVSLFLVVFSFFPKAGHKVIAWGVKVLTKLRICKKPEKWIEKGNTAIDNNKKNMSIIFKSKRVLIVGTLLSFVFNLAQCSMPYFTLLLFSDALAANGLTPSWQLWFDVTRITFFIYCAITIVPTPGNSGAADGTFYGLFSSVLMAGTCFTGMMIWRMYSFYSYIILGVTVTVTMKVVGIIRAKRGKTPIR